MSDTRAAISKARLKAAWALAKKAYADEQAAIARRLGKSPEEMTLKAQMSEPGPCGTPADVGKTLGLVILTFGGIALLVPLFIWLIVDLNILNVFVLIFNVFLWFIGVDERLPIEWR